MNWVFAAGLALFLMLAALLVFSDFADVPCQDGVWKSAQAKVRADVGGGRLA